MQAKYSYCIINRIETKTIRLPRGFKCTECVFQLSWKIAGKFYHTCSDVILPQIWYDAYMDDYLCDGKNPNSVCIKGYYPRQSNFKSHYSLWHILPYLMLHTRALRCRCSLYDIQGIQNSEWQ